MFEQRWWLRAGALAAVWLQVSRVLAEPSACRVVSRDNLVDCVMRASLETEAASASVRAAEGRLLAARPWFPSAPTLSLSGARRSSGGESDLNWSATLGVELEVAGQRAARREAATAEREAALKTREAGARATAFVAWKAYFDELAAVETARLVERLEAGARRVAEAARAGAERGAFAGAEADLADAAWVRVVQRRIAATRELALARVMLAQLLGLAATSELTVQGTLTPLQASERSGTHAEEAPSVAALEAESRALAARANVERRGRVPSPVVSVFAQRDGFNERVFGAGVTLPLPLPEPVGRLRAGEIAENEALSRRAHLLANNERRATRARLLQALARYEAARQAAATYTSERLQRSEATLASLSTAVEAGRIAIRDALILQEPLLEQLLGDIEARRALCVASAELLLAMNAHLEAGAAR